MESGGNQEKQGRVGDRTQEADRQTRLVETKEQEIRTARDFSKGTLEARNKPFKNSGGGVGNDLQPRFLLFYFHGW